MISKFSNNWHWIVLVVGVLGPSSVGLAQVGVTTADEVIPRGPSTFPLSVNQEPSDRSELKCWQNGRLILDEHNWRPERAGLPGVTLKSQGAAFDTLWLSSFGNETFCYLKAKN